MATLRKELGNTLGAILLGDIVTAILYGITTIQTYTYYKRGRNDSIVLRSLVGFLWILASLHLALITHTTYNYTVLDFANILALEEIVWSVPSFVLVTVVNDLIIRILFCHRVWRLSERNWPLAAINITSTLFILGIGLVFAIRIYSTQFFFSLTQPDFSRILYIGLASAAAGDVLIAMSLTFLLGRRRTGFSRTDSMIKMLMFYSVETGTLTSLCAISCLITFTMMRENFIYMSLYFILSELFLSSLLASLNARRGIREKGGLVAIPLSGLSSSNGVTSHQTRGSETLNELSRGIHIGATIHKHADSVIDITQAGAWRPCVDEESGEVAIAY